MGWPRTVLDEVARERADYRISAVLQDALGMPIPGAALNTLYLTLYVDDGAKTLLNNADHNNILNNGRGVVDSAGNVTITLLPDDNVILDNLLAEEVHVALVEWTYNASASAGRHELEFRVRNMARVT